MEEFVFSLLSNNKLRSMYTVTIIISKENMAWIRHHAALQLYDDSLRVKQKKIERKEKKKKIFKP